ncbi:MAG: hypothetical protein EU547_02390 [Promethearchaeota archaeon]|nr:MAG: hypothetical protein EU547_02390 [Candidatus Lokiarchaeota archaeon]
MKNLGEYSFSMEIMTLFEFMLFLTYSIMAPGVILLLITYIRKLTPRIHGNVLKHYHIHENLFGLLLFIIGISFIFFRNNIIKYEVFWKDLRVILAFINVFTFVFLFFGSFFLSRDIDDILRFKFIEKLPKDHSSHLDQEGGDQTIFSKINEKDIHFFTTPLIPLYPAGMIFTSFSFLMVIYGSDFLLYEIFFIDYNTIVILGYIICCIAAAMLGLDWFRLFKVFYPDLYSIIHHRIEELKNSPSNNL